MEIISLIVSCINTLLVAIATVITYKMYRDSK